jgi:hypothetical protein
MLSQFSTNHETSVRVCPVAEMLEKHGKSFGPAASDAMTIHEDLDDALYGLDKALTPADIKAADLESLEVAEANLKDLLEQAQEALLTIQRIIELRMNPDAQWPA